MGWHGAGGWWIFWPLGWLVFLFLIFGAGRWLFWGRRFWGPYPGSPYGGYGGLSSHPDRSYALLRERLARGEIGEEEYDRLRTLLDK